MAHAELSPSSAARWMTCPGSVALCRGIEDKGSRYADEGTAAHELAERILKGEDGAALVGGMAENGLPFTAEMLVDVRKYTDYVQNLVETTGGTLFVEEKLPLDHITGETGARGTADAVVITDDEIIVIDLKFGMGEKVDA